MPTEHGPRVALVSAIIGGDTAFGRAIAFKNSDEGTRLVMSGNPDSKTELEMLGRECARIGAPAVDIYAMPDVTNADVAHSLMRTIISRQGGVDLLVVCPFSLLLLHANPDVVPQMAERAKEEVRYLMAERQKGDTRCVRGIITIIPDPNGRQPGVAPAETVAVQAASAATNLMSKVGLSEQKPRLPGVGELQGLGRSLMQWSDKTAQAMCPEAITQVDVVVPPEVVRAALELQAEGKAAAVLGAGQEDGAKDPRVLQVRRVAEAAADAAILPWLHKQPFRAQATAPHMRVRISAEGQRGPIKLHWPGEKGGLAPSPAGTNEPPAGPMHADEEEAGWQVVQLDGTPEGADSKLLPGQQRSGAKSVFSGLDGGPGSDREGVLLGHDPGPSEEGTMRAEDKQAVWVKALEPPPAEGIIEATGARKAPGALTRLRAPGELGLGKQDKPGAVIINADPDNLEPSMSKEDYQEEPENRDPNLMVHCWYPFNGETPHRVLSEKFLTPASLFYVRNHLPVPKVVDGSNHQISVGGLGLPDGQQLALPDLKAGKYGPVLDQQAVLQCAGNRRNELASIKLVEGRAPWNHGAIGNSIWTGVMMRDVLGALGFPVNDPLSVVGKGGDQQHGDVKTLPSGMTEARLPELSLIMEGMDWHRKTKKHFEVSIPLSKVLDPQGGVMLAWAQNGEPLLPDHGYPVRAIVPGYVGTRSVKWLQSMRVEAQESQSAWQQVDYKIMPHLFHTLPQWKPKAGILPGIMNMNVQSAILEPEAGTVIDAKDVKALWVRGYAWCGAGLPIIRVDVTCDEGSTWELADIVEQHHGQHGQAWAWVKWQLPLKVPPAVRREGGKWRIACKAFNRNGDTQTGNATDIWNFRGLACNSWHWADLHVVPEQP